MPFLRDAVALERHAQIRMMRPNAYGEAVHAALGTNGYGLKREATFIDLFDGFHLRRPSVDEIASRTEPAEIKLDSDILR